MIKKYMNQLYKEIEQIRRKIDGGHLKYFGHREFLNANSYVVILKNGSYFYINIGTKYIPKLKKKDIAFISKQYSVSSIDPNWGRWMEYTDSNRGCTRYDWTTGHHEYDRFEHDMFEKYKVDLYKEIDTGAWD